jgi:hypothetical protein
MQDPTALEKDKGCMEVVALLQLNGYRFRFRREAVGYKADPRFHPFSGRMKVMMMALTVLRRRGLMMPQQTLRRRQLIWTLMDILLRTLLVLQRCQLLRWL